MALRRSKSADARGDAPRADASRSAPADGPDSLIADGMTLDGDCQTDGALRVDGHVTGNIRARRVTVGPSGRVDGDITGPDHGAGGSEHAVLIDGRVGGAVRAPRVEIGRSGSVGSGMKVHEAVVRGRVVGAVVTEHRLLLEDTAVVEGDVTARRLGLKEGGQVFGTIRIGEPPADEAPAKRPAGNREAAKG